MEYQNHSFHLKIIILIINVSNQNNMNKKISLQIEGGGDWSRDLKVGSWGIAKTGSFISKNWVIFAKIKQKNIFKIKLYI